MDVVASLTPHAATFGAGVIGAVVVFFADKVRSYILETAVVASLTPHAATFGAGVIGAVVVFFADKVRSYILETAVDRVLVTGTGHGWHFAGIDALTLGVMPFRWCEGGPKSAKVGVIADKVRSYMAVNCGF